MSINRDQIDSNERSDIHNSRGLELKKRGWLDEAIKEFKNAVYCAPKVAEGHENLATAYVDKGDLLKALSSYATALSLEPENPIALHNLGCFIANHSDNLASICFKKAYKIDPDLYESRYNLGLCLASRNQHEAALAHFEAALDHNDQDTDIRFHLALSLMALGRNVRAIKELSLVVKQEPKDEQAWYCLGACYIDQGFWAEAKDCFLKTLKLNPKHIDALLTLASLLQRQNNTKEAKPLIERAKKLDPHLSAQFIRDDEFLA